MNDKYDKELIKLLSEIASPEIMSAILSNLLTPGEREELGVRLQIFKGLISGQSQRDLAKKLNVSLATISRGSRELKYGKTGVVKAMKYD